MWGALIGAAASVASSAMSKKSSSGGSASATPAGNTTNEGGKAYAAGGDANIELTSSINPIIAVDSTMSNTGNVTSSPAGGMGLTMPSLSQDLGGGITTKQVLIGAGILLAGIVIIKAVSK